MREKISKSKLEYYQKEIAPLKGGFDNVVDHVIITDENANILYANKAAEEKTGFSAQEMLGNNPADLWGGNMPQEFYKKMWRQIKEEKQPFVGEVHNKRKDGTEYWQELHISAVMDKGGEVKFFIGIELDITDRKKREQFREEFISIVGHQLRNPLTVVNWTLNWLFESGSLSKDQRKMLEQAYRHNKTLRDLVEDLLTISRTSAEGNSKEEFELDVQINDIVEMTQKQFPGITILFKKEGDSFSLLVNKSLARQVFTSIITNAAKYSAKNFGMVEVALKQGAGEYLFVVKDNGIGIPREDQPKVFSRFFRASNANGAKERGTGLGLFVAKMISDSFGWKVFFKSELGKGTTFFVKIPI